MISKLCFLLLCSANVNAHRDDGWYFFGKQRDLKPVEHWNMLGIMVTNKVPCKVQNEYVEEPVHIMLFNQSGMMLQQTSWSVAVSSIILEYQCTEKAVKTPKEKYHLERNVDLNLQYSFKERLMEGLNWLSSELVSTVLKVSEEICSHRIPWDLLSFLNGEEDSPFLSLRRDERQKSNNSSYKALFTTLFSFPHISFSCLSAFLFTLLSTWFLNFSWWEKCKNTYPTITTCF